MSKYRFSVGDKARIRARKTRCTTSSTNVWKHDGEVVTIKALCPFTWAYELEELPGLWQDACLERV